MKTIKALVVFLSLQLVWSYHRLQAIGLIRFLHIFRRTLPPLKEPPAREVLAVLPFSTHPLFAPLILGRILGILSRGESPREARRLILNWMGTFSAFGDILYWQGSLWILGSLLTFTLLTQRFDLAFLIVLFSLLLEVAIRVLFFEAGFRSQTPFPHIVQKMKLLSLRTFLPLFGYLGWLGIFLILSVSALRTLTLKELMIFSPALLVGIFLSVRTRFRTGVFWLLFILSVIRNLLKYV
jgi:mannose/fructose/N-acetylgalactosamine-specific phosphotransferase system component IID